MVLSGKKLIDNPKPGLRGHMCFETGLLLGVVRYLTGSSGSNSSGLLYVGSK